MVPPSEAGLKLLAVNDASGYRSADSTFRVVARISLVPFGQRLDATSARANDERAELDAGLETDGREARADDYLA